MRSAPWRSFLRPVPLSFLVRLAVLCWYLFVPFTLLPFVDFPNLPLMILPLPATSPLGAAKDGQVGLGDPCAEGVNGVGSTRSAEVGTAECRPLLPPLLPEGAP